MISPTYAQFAALDETLARRMPLEVYQHSAGNVSYGLPENSAAPAKRKGEPLAGALHFSRHLESRNCSRRSRSRLPLPPRCLRRYGRSIPSR